MLMYASDLELDAELEGDVAVIGAGAAGITIAEELKNSGKKVILLESGTLKLEQKHQDLYRGRADGKKVLLPQTYLADSRLRYFGGSTNHWAGWCRPLDRIDFEKRDWVPDSGWPITLEDIKPYYDRASDYCEIDSFYTGRREEVIRNNKLLSRDDCAFRPEFFYFSPPVRFGKKYRESLESARDVRVVLGGSCVEIVCDQDQRNIIRLQCATLGNKRFTVRARQYILACGGIENARILLNSRSVAAEGLGNAGDMVGRYYQDHPIFYLPLRYFIHGSPEDLLNFKRRSGQWSFASHTVCGVFVPTEEYQKRSRRLNTSIAIEHDINLTHELSDPFLQKLGKQLPVLDQELSKTDESLLPFSFRYDREAFGTALTGTLAIRTEQSPSRRSRVRLDDARDALGMRRIVLEWEPSQRDFDSVYGHLQEFGRELLRNFCGRLKMMSRDEIDRFRPVTSFHHMGTTRMSDDPRTGVVDGDCRMHGVSNLYVAGSSVFPSSGYANPTLTLIALSVRLADHIKRKAD